MRFHSALIAALVAIVAVAAGAQAAGGKTSDGSTPSSIKRFDGPTKKPTRIVPLTDEQAKGFLKVSGGSDNYNVAPLVNNFAVPGVCRYPTYCSFNADNIGATLEDEGNTCTTGGGDSIGFDNTVWFRVNTPVTGLMDVIYDTASAGLTPVFLISAWNAGALGADVFCDVANPLNRVFSDTWQISGSIAMATASLNPPGTEGTYRVVLRWDPDTDGDSLTDGRSDRCDTAAGPSSLRGCPDSDGDRIPNIDDRCDTARGPASLGGCPDSDGDRLIDSSDRCPRESSAGRTDKNANGCPDYSSIPDLRASIAGVIRRNRVVGVKFTRLAFRSRAPRGTRLRVSCKPKRNCKLRRRGSLRRRIRSLRFRSKRTKVTVKATKSGYVGKVFTMTVTFRTVSGGGRNVILRGPKKRCIPVGRRASRRCTSSLLLR